MGTYELLYGWSGEPAGFPGQRLSWFAERLAESPAQG